MKVYIIITQDKIGGAEKRFAGLWAQLVKNSDSNNTYYLVLSQNLLNELLEIDDLRETLKNYNSNIIIQQFSGSYIQNLKQANRFISDNNSKDCCFHFIEFFPVYFPVKAKVLFSMTASNLGIYSFIGQAFQYFGGLLATKIDILDPTIYQNFKTLFWFKKKKISLTPCTYCNTEKFIIEEKKNWIVFLGIFTHIKQPLKYLQSIPTIFNKIESLKLADLKFYILGTDGMETEMKTEIKKDIYKNIPIEILFTSNPETFLNKSKVFVSLQKFNNFPSKSLVEAMAAGNIPLVTDNGHTRLLANENFSYYVKEDFANEEIANEVFQIFSLNKDNSGAKANLARKFVLENHTLSKMCAYYSNSFYNFTAK